MRHSHKKVVREDGKIVHTIVIPQSLTKYMFQQAHDVLGHDGTARNYQYPSNCIIVRSYIKDVNTHAKQCIKCKQQNMCQWHYAQLLLDMPSACMHFITIDLNGKFKTSPKGHKYAITVMDMLKLQLVYMAGYKRGWQSGACLLNIYSKFGRLHNSLLHNTN